MHYFSIPVKAYSPFSRNEKMAAIYLFYHLYISMHHVSYLTYYQYPLYYKVQ